jgi:hypothetical protein
LCLCFFFWLLGIKSYIISDQREHTMPLSPWNLMLSTTVAVAGGRSGTSTLGSWFHMVGTHNEREYLCVG